MQKFPASAWVVMPNQPIFGRLDGSAPLSDTSGHHLPVPFCITREGIFSRQYIPISQLWRSTAIPFFTQLRTQSRLAARLLTTSPCVDIVVAPVPAIRHTALAQDCILSLCQKSCPLFLHQRMRRYCTLVPSEEVQAPKTGRCPSALILLG